MLKSYEVRMIAKKCFFTKDVTLRYALWPILKRICASGGFES